ncbi:MAG: hypothetical protein IH985_00460 [Planctomycetes bacterium]|nr:hypothetical protein [Planctomycetota bacterium]
MKHGLLAAAGLITASSAGYAQTGGPFEVLHFDLNALTGEFYDAPGGAAGGGNRVPSLDPNGASAAGGAAPFSGSLEFLISSSSVLAAVGGNNTGSLLGPFSAAGNGGVLTGVGGHIDFAAGMVVGGQFDFSNNFGDSLVGSIDTSVPWPLTFAFGIYDVTTLFNNAAFTDAGGDGFFGDPANGVDLSLLLNPPLIGLFKIPGMAPDGSFIDWDVFVTVPAPAGAFMFAGLMIGYARRRR